MPRTGPSGTWKCPSGCDQEAHFKRHGRGCPHLEKLIGPVVGEDRRRIVFTNQLDRFESSRVDLYAGNSHTDEDTLRAKLAQFSLSPKKIDVIVDRLVTGKTFKDIAIDRGYAEGSAAKRAFDDALKQLQKRGYGLEGK